MTDDNMPSVIRTSPAKVMSPLNQDVVTDDYFVDRWQEILPRYIGGGRPSYDTLNHYFSYINQFIGWCQSHARHPLSIHDYQMRIYLQWLYERGYKNDTIAVKLVAIRCFFTVAHKLKLIDENPCADIYVPNATPDELIRFFTPDQMFEICEVFKGDPDPFLRLRNTSILYLMGVEGLRNIEIHRMNREDIDWDVGSIFIRGKGHNRHILPCDDTMKYVDMYLQVCPEPKKEGAFSPMFISDSNKNLHGRVSRNGIRYIMNQALESSGFKKPGISCHVFRHSTGTNLYAATKDLRLVQETLGHSDPKTTARYAHLQERMTKRRTAAIVPRPASAEEKGSNA